MQSKGLQQRKYTYVTKRKYTPRHVNKFIRNSIMSAYQNRYLFRKHKWHAKHIERDVLYEMINLFARNPVHFILIIVLRNSKNKKVQNEKWRSLLKRATIDLHEHKEVNEEDRMSQDYNRFIILFIMEYVDCIYSSLFMNVCYWATIHFTSTKVIPEPIHRLSFNWSFKRLCWPILPATIT